MELQELREEPLAAATPAGFALAEVMVRDRTNGSNGTC